MGCLHLPAVTLCHLVALQRLWKLQPLILESIYRTGFLFLGLLGDDLSLILPHAPKTSTGVLMGNPEPAVIRDVTFLEKAWLVVCSEGECRGHWDPTGKRHRFPLAQSVKSVKTVRSVNPRASRCQSTVEWRFLLTPLKTQAANWEDHDLWQFEGRPVSWDFGNL